MSSKAKGKNNRDKASNNKNAGGSGGKAKPKKDKSKKDGKYTVPRLVELESNFMMRMPEPYAGNLQEALENGGLKERLQVEFQEDGRKAKVVFDGVIFLAKLLDLPCIIEVWKSFDKKSLWKTGDVCQILICRDPEEHSFTSDEEDENTFDYFKKKMHDAKKYQYPHGITPPLKNVRRRRFRKTAKQKYVDAPEIEKEVKRLLRADVSAVDVTFDIINDEQEKGTEKSEDIVDDLIDIDVGGPSIEHLLDESSNMSSAMGGPGSDIEMPPEALDPTPVSSQQSSEEAAGILPDISSSEDEGGDDGVGGAGLEDLIQQRAEVHQRLREVQSKVHEQEVRVAGAANQFLKQRFESVLNTLREEEASLAEQFSALS